MPRKVSRGFMGPNLKSKGDRSKKVSKTQAAANVKQITEGLSRRAARGKRGKR